MTAVTQPRVLASEWTKLHSLRSSRFSLLVAVGLVVGLGLVVPWLSVANWQPGTSTVGFNAVERSLAGIFLAQLAFAAGQAIFATKHADASLGDPNVTRAVIFAYEIGLVRASER
jgi:hypothetical protein